MAGKRKHHKAGAGRNRHHSRNPFGQPWAKLIQLIGGAGLGMLANVTIPGWILAMMNQPDSGFLPYLIGVGVVIGPAMLLKKLPELAQGWIAGSGGALVWRGYDDLTGSNLLTITPGTQSGVSSFFTKNNVRYPLPAQNVFGAYARGGRGSGGPMMLTAGTPQASANPAAKTAGMHWMQM